MIKCDRCKELNDICKELININDVDAAVYLCRKCIALRTATDSGPMLPYSVSQQEYLRRRKIEMFKLISRETSTNFAMTFDNGYSISMVIGQVAHDDSVTSFRSEGSREIISPNIECAVLDEKGHLVTTRWNDYSDDVIPRMNSNELLELMKWAADQ